MVTSYDVISSRWSSQVLDKIHVFFKVKLVDKMKQSTYLCVILHVKHKKLPILAFFTRFLIIGKIQGGGQDGDQASQASTAHKINLILWRRSKAFLWR